VLGVDFADLATRRLGPPTPGCPDAGPRRRGPASIIYRDRRHGALQPPRTSTTSTPAWTAYNPGSPILPAPTPTRLSGVGSSTAMRTPEEGIDDLESIRELGLKA